MSHEIKCKECGKFTKNSDHCQYCGALISHTKIREQEVQQEIERKKSTPKEPSYIDNMRNHKSWFVRIFGHGFHYTWVAFMAVGAFIAWLIAAIAA